MTQKLTRRTCLKTSLAAGSILLCPVSSVFANPVNERLNTAFVGVGGRGTANLNEIAKDPRVRVAALCDIDEKILADRAEKFGVTIPLRTVTRCSSWMKSTL